MEERRSEGAEGEEEVEGGFGQSSCKSLQKLAGLKRRSSVNRVKGQGRGTRKGCRLESVCTHTHLLHLFLYIRKRKGCRLKCVHELICYCHAIPIVIASFFFTRTVAQGLHGGAAGALSAVLLAPSTSRPSCCSASTSRSSCSSALWISDPVHGRETSERERE